jgi:catechol 2,3-dioxygenase-like lactoylglutathione lyase family enzyme
VGVKFAYTALQVDNIDRSEEFYTSILGMQRSVRKNISETKGEMCVLKSGRGSLELNWYEEFSLKRGNNLDHLAFEAQTIAEFRRLMRKLRAKKIEIHEYLETKGWNRFFIEDPDRNWVEIFVRK